MKKKPRKNKTTPSKQLKKEVNWEDLNILSEDATSTLNEQDMESEDERSTE